VVIEDIVNYNLVTSTWSRTVQKVEEIRSVEDNSFPKKTRYSKRKSIWLAREISQLFFIHARSAKAATCIVSRLSRNIYKRMVGIIC
jgi:hypothetical protein